MWKPIALLLLFFFAASLSLHAESLSQPNYTRAEAISAVANASAFINETNQSSYLIFSANLTAAYSYLGKAELLENSSPASSVVYAHDAISSARNAYQRIGVYREDSLAVVIIFSAAMAAILYKFMMPVKNKKRAHGK